MADKESLLMPAAGVTAQCYHDVPISDLPGSGTQRMKCVCVFCDVKPPDRFGFQDQYKRVQEAENTFGI